MGTNPSPADMISTLLRSIGRNTLMTVIAKKPLLIPRASFLLFTLYPEDTMEYLEPLLNSEPIANIVLNTILFIAIQNRRRRGIFQRLLEISRKYPRVRRDILYIIATAFRGVRYSIARYQDIPQLLDAEDLDDLSDRIITLGYIFEGASDMRLAELLLGLVEKTNGAVMRPTVSALARIFRDADPLISRYGPIFSRLSKVKAEALIRAISTLCRSKHYKYYRNPYLRYMFMYSLLRGDMRLKAQAIIGLGYIFERSEAKHIVSLFRNFVGLDDNVDLAIARATKLIFGNKDTATVRNIMLRLLLSRNREAAREAYTVIGGSGLDIAQFERIIGILSENRMNPRGGEKIDPLRDGIQGKVLLRIATVLVGTDPSLLKRITSRCYSHLHMGETHLVNYKVLYDTRVFGRIIVVYNLWVGTMDRQRTWRDLFRLMRGLILIVDEVSDPRKIKEFVRDFWDNVGIWPVMVLDIAKNTKDYWRRWLAKTDLEIMARKYGVPLDYRVVDPADIIDHEILRCLFVMLVAHILTIIRKQMSRVGNRMSSFSMMLDLLYRGPHTKTQYRRT